MPKLKTNRGACKRFKAVKGGFVHKSSYRRHLLTSKTPKRKRQLRRRNPLVAKCDEYSVKRLINE